MARYPRRRRPGTRTRHRLVAGRQSLWRAWRTSCSATPPGVPARSRDDHSAVPEATSEPDFLRIVHDGCPPLVSPRRGPAARTPAGVRYRGRHRVRPRHIEQGYRFALQQVAIRSPGPGRYQPGPGAGPSIGGVTAVPANRKRTYLVSGLLALVAVVCAVVAATAGPAYLQYVAIGPSARPSLAWSPCCPAGRSDGDDLAPDGRQISRSFAMWPVDAGPRRTRRTNSARWRLERRGARRRTSAVRSST